ncbi:MAG: DUF3592 domain-containing protein [Verrucomicrobiota bacterium]
MKSKGKQHLKVPVWVSLLFISAGLILVILQAQKYFRANQSHKWPSVEGVMLRSDWVKSGKSYGASVAYRYKIDDRAYSSETLALWPCAGSKEAERLVKAHSAGFPVNVRYDPNQPGRAVLISGGSILGSVGITGAGCLVIGCWSLFDTIRMRAQKQVFGNC